MEWILNHIWIVVVIAGLVAKAMQAARGKNSPTKTTAEPPRRQEYVDAELAERTRKIREEIRRKIEERRGQTAAPPAPDPARPRMRLEDRSPQATPPPTVLELPTMVRRVLQPAAEPAPAPVPPPLPVEREATADELVRQAALADQLRVVVAKRAGADRRAAFASTFADQEQAALVVGRGALLDDLHDPASLRRAFVLRELLGPPVALRR